MADDNQVAVRFGADTSNLESGIRRAAQSMNGFGSHVYAASQQASKGSDSITSSINDMIGKMTAGLGGLSAVFTATLGTVTGLAVSIGTAAQHAADTLSAPVEAISRFAPVAAAAGMSIEDFATKFAEIDDKLRKGDEGIQNALKALRIDPNTFKAETASAQINTIITALNGLQNSYAKTAAAQVLFGTNAGALITALDGSKKKIQELSTEADRAGISISSGLADKIRGTQGIIDQIGARFREVGEAIKGFAITIYDQLKPAIDYFLQSFSNTVGMITNWIEGVNNATRAGGGLTQVLTMVRQGLLLVAAAGQTFASSFGEIMSTTVDVAKKAFTGIHDMAIAIWTDITGVWGRALQALGNATRDALLGIGQMFVDLGKTAVAALSFQDASAAFKTLQANASDSTGKIKSDIASITASGAGASFTTMVDGISTDMSKLITDVSAKFAATRAELQAEWAKPITAPKVDLPQAGNMPGSDKRDSDAIRAAQEAVQGQIEVLRAGLAQKKALYEQDAATGKMSEDQKVSATKIAMQQEYEAELALLQKEAAIDGLKVQQRQAILNKIAVLEISHNTQMIEQTTQSAQKQYEAYKSAFEKIGDTVSQGFMGMIQGTETLRQMAQKILLGIISDFISAGVRMVADNAAKIALQVAQTQAGEAAKTTAVISGVAARTSAEAGGAASSLAASAGSIITQILADAKAAFAGVFAFLAPIMGPAAAGPAAAAMGTVTGMASFDTGAWQLPSDMVAQVHQGEMIVPASHTPWAQSVMSNASGPGRGDTHIHNHNWNVNASGNRKPSDVISEIRDHAHEVGRALQRGMNSGKPRR